MTEQAQIDQATAEAAAQAAAQAEAAAAAKAAAKAQADEAKAQAKAAKEAAAAEAKAQKEAAKLAAKAAKEAAAAEAKAAKEAELKAKADAKAADLAKKAEEKAAAAQAKVKVVLESRNGVTRPRPEGSCGKVWALADQLSRDLGQPVPISHLAPVAAANGLNDATTRTQYARWKTFNGVFGPVAKPAVAVVATAPAAAETQAA